MENLKTKPAAEELKAKLIAYLDQMPEHMLYITMGFIARLCPGIGEE